MQCLYVHIIYIRICKEAGIQLKHTKTVLVDKQIIGLGFFFDLNDNQRTVEVPDKKIKKYIKSFKELIINNVAKAKLAQSVVGKMEHVQIILWPLRCYCRSIYNQIPIYDKNNKNQNILITDNIKHSINTWIDLMPLIKGIKIDTILNTPKIFDHEVITDGSDVGYGGTVGKLWFYGKYEKCQVNPNNNKNIRDRELYPIAIILNSLGPIFTQKIIKIKCDNKNVVRALINKDIRNEKSQDLVIQICEIAMKYKFRFYVYYIKGEKNVYADALSRLQINKFKRIARERKYEINTNPYKYKKYYFDFA